MTDYEVLDKEVSDYLGTPEGKEFIARLKIRRELMAPMERIRSHGGKRLVGMSHGGTLKFAASVPTHLYFRAKQLFPNMPDKECQDMFIRRYPALRAEG